MSTRANALIKNSFKFAYYIKNMIGKLSIEKLKVILNEIKLERTTK